MLGAWEAAEETWEKVRAGALDVHFLMLSVALGAAAVGAWHEGALLLFLFSASGAMEHYAEDRTQREIGALLRGAPKTATVLDDAGGGTRGARGELAPGMIVRVNGGRQVPVDLRVTKGESACDESNLTGESRPVPKASGDDLLAGTLNLQGLLEGRVLRPAQESALQKVIRLIEKAQTLRAPAQRFTDKFGTGYTYGMLGLCAAMFFVWWFGFRLPAFVTPGPPQRVLPRDDAPGRRVAVRAGAEHPVGDPVGHRVGRAAGRPLPRRRGVGKSRQDQRRRPRQNRHPDRRRTPTPARRDVCGRRGRLCAAWPTTSRGSPTTRFPAPSSAWARRRNSRCRNPSISRQFRARACGRRSAAGSTPSGRRELVDEFSCPPARRPAEVEDAAEVCVGGPGLAGRLVFRDELRPESAARCADCARRAWKPSCSPATAPRPPNGSRANSASREVRAGLLPEGKLAAMRGTQAGRHPPRGDGGRRRQRRPEPRRRRRERGDGRAGFSDAALEQAAVVLMNDRLENFFVAYELSRRTERVIRQNLAVALGTVVLMVGASLFGAVPLALGVAAHEGSTVLVVLNSLRLLLSKRPRRAADRQSQDGRCETIASANSLFRLSTLLLHFAFAFAASLCSHETACVPLQIVTPVKAIRPRRRRQPGGPRRRHGSNLPPFLKVDGIYYLNGNEDDMVRVLELSPTRAGCACSPRRANPGSTCTTCPSSRPFQGGRRQAGKAPEGRFHPRRRAAPSARPSTPMPPRTTCRRRRPSSGRTSASSSSRARRSTIPTART